MFLSVSVCVCLWRKTPLIFWQTHKKPYKNRNHHIRKFKKQSKTKKMEVSPGRRCQTRSRSSAAARRRRRRNEANETAKKVVESPANRVPAGLLLSWTYSPPPPLPPQMPRVGSSHSLSLSLLYSTLSQSFFFYLLLYICFPTRKHKKKNWLTHVPPFLVSSRRANQQKPYLYIHWRD